MQRADAIDVILRTAIFRQLVDRRVPHIVGGKDRTVADVRDVRSRTIDPRLSHRVVSTHFVGRRMFVDLAANKQERQQAHDGEAGSLRSANKDYESNQRHHTQSHQLGQQPKM